MRKSTKINPMDAPKSDRSTRRRPDPLAITKLLDEWMHGDEVEQRETFAMLREARDKQRPAGYKLFP